MFLDAGTRADGRNDFPEETTRYGRPAFVDMLREIAPCSAKSRRRSCRTGTAPLERLCGHRAKAGALTHRRRLNSTTPQSNLVASSIR